MFRFFYLCFLFLLTYTGNLLHAQSKGVLTPVLFKANTFNQITEDKVAEQWLSEQLGNSNFSLLKSSEKVDELGYRHVKYKQTYNQIPVFGAELVFHYNENGLYLINGDYQSISNLENHIVLSPSQAINKSIQLHPSDQYEWECKDAFSQLKAEHWVYENNGLFYVVYAINLYSVQPLFKTTVFIDAQTGEERGALEQLHHTDVPGQGNTLHHGSKSFTIDSVNANLYRLQNSIGGGIKTVDLNSTTSSENDFTHTTNVWNIPNENVQAALDVHWGMEKTYNYFLTKHNYYSFDNENSLIKGRVNYSTNFTGAFWDGYQLTFGGQNTTSVSPYTSIEIVGHEFTHGVVQHTANLNSSYESGALNESFADIFGYCIRLFADPNNSTFYIGDMVTTTSGNPFRNMANPNELGHPDTYLGLHWAMGSADNGGIHTNCGVQNYWFYLLSEGGAGTNDLGVPFTVSGIGASKAAQIAFRSLSYYLTTASDYIQARENSIQAAIDIFGNCSEEVIQVTNAWHAVGLGTTFQSDVVADFTSNASYSCTTPYTVSFSNVSTNNVSNYWDFGDGTTSTEVSPSHTYTTPGNYDVSLIITSTGECGNIADTLLITEYIEVDNLSNLQSVNCNTLINANFAIEVDTFEFGPILNTVYSNEKLQDYTCDFNETITEGEELSVLLKTGLSHRKHVWIDFDNSGSFSIDELVYNQNTDTLSVISISHPDIVYNTPLRLRALAYGGLSLNTACPEVFNGVQQDYRITILENQLSPVAQFLSNETEISPNMEVAFQNLSEHLPTSYLWSFPGGVPSTSTLENPIVEYSSFGTYDVTLIATNSNGSDTITVSDYITVSNQFVLCNNSQAFLQTGELYDNGGPDGDYTIGSVCELHITPTCAEEIILSFTEFETASGNSWFKVFDGDPNSSNLLLYHYGNTIPADVVSTTGEMFIRFTTWGAATGSGFAASWTTNLSTTPSVAEILVTDTNLIYNQPTQFSSGINSPEDSYSWNFGDGTTSINQNPIKTYTTPGVYQVELIVNGCFDSDTSIQEILVQSPPDLIVEDTINTSFSCGNLVVDSFTVYNNGSGDMVIQWDDVLPGDSLEVLLLTYLVNSPTVYNLTNQLEQIGPNVNVSTYGDPLGGQFISSLSDKHILIIPNINTTLTLMSTALHNFVNNGGQVLILGNDKSKVNSTGLLTSNTDAFYYSNLGHIENTHQTLNSLSSPLNLEDAFQQEFVDADYISLIEGVQGQNSAQDYYGYKEIGDGIVYYLGSGYNNNPIVGEEVFSNLIEHIYSETLGYIGLSSVIDTIPAGDSIQVVYSINAESLLAGQYIDSISLYSSDPLNDSINVYIDFIIEDEIVLDFNASIDFGNINQGGTSSELFTLENLGCGTLAIDSITFTGNTFSTSLNATSITPYSLSTLWLYFSTTTIGSYVDTMFLHYADGVEEVVLEGECFGGGVLSFTPEYIQTTLMGCSDSATIPITLYNVGSEEVNGSLLITDNVDASNGTTFRDGFENAHFNDWTTSINSEYFSIDSLEPASGHYCLKSKHLSYGQAHLSRNFSADEDYISFRLKSEYSNSTSGGIAITNNFGALSMFDVRKEYDNYMVIYGGVPITHPIVDHDEWTRFEFKNIDYIAKTFDLYINESLMGSGLNFFSSTAPPTRFQIKSGANTNFHAQYFDDIQVGQVIESTWAIATTDTFELAVGDSLEFDVTIYADGLVAGSHNTFVEFTIDGEGLNSTTLPIHLLIQTQDSLTLSQSCIDYGDQLQFISQTELITLTNHSCDTVFINSFETSTPFFSISMDENYILPWESNELNISFGSDNVGMVEDTLFMTTNDSVWKVCLLGEIVGAPQAVYQDTVHTYVTECNTEFIDVGFWLYNTGLDTLYWDDDLDEICFDNFEQTGFGAIWETHAGVYASGFCGTSSGNYAARFSGNFGRKLSTYGFSILGESYITIDIKKGDGDFSCGEPSAGEDLYLSYSIDNGQTWEPFYTFLSTNTNSSQFETLTITIPELAVTSHTKFKLEQINFSGYGEDVWVVDNFLIQTNNADEQDNLVDVNDSVFIETSVFVGDLSSGEFAMELNFATNDAFNIASSITSIVHVVYPPCGDFNFNEINDCSGLFSFAGTSIDENAEFSWNFGYGAVNSNQNPLHQYDESGIYDVVLIISNDYNSDTITHQLNVDITNAQIEVLSPLTIANPIQFASSSTNASFYQWNFGDGTFSNQESPSHVFAHPQLYVISLYVTNDAGCSSIVHDTIDLTAFVGLSEGINDLYLYPNPVSSQLYIQNQSHETLVQANLYSTLGKLIHSYGNLGNGSTIKLDAESIPQGLYTLKLVNNKGRETQYKLVVER